MKKIFIIGCLLLTSACNMPVSTPLADPTHTATLLPPPEAGSTLQTETPTETFTPAPTATLAPPALYFTEEFDTPSSYWEFTQAGGATALTSSIENGSLRIGTSSPDTWFVGIYTAHTYSNVFVRANVTITPVGSVGLICRYTSDGWYEFNAATDGTYSILLGQWLSPGVVKYIPILNESSSQFALNTANEIGLFCEDNFLHLYLNDNLIRRVDVTNYGLTEGSVGITASSFAEVPVSVLFEWVKIGKE
ncbi:MAG: hypothetical protein J0M11_06880 [Anaerolineae bacterium]|nr:hypothetical protein [Anaerolineae bacterium]